MYIIFSTFFISKTLNYTDSKFQDAKGLHIDYMSEMPWSHKGLEFLLQKVKSKRANPNVQMKIIEYKYISEKINTNMIKTEY